MTWEPVRRAQARHEANQPRIRITGGKEITITTAALALLGNPEWVRLYCDRAAHLFALRASTASEPESFRLAGPPASSVRRFSTVALKQAFGVGSGRQEFVPRQDGDLLVFGPYEGERVPAARVREIVAAANGRGPG